MTKHELEASRIKTAGRLNAIAGLEDLTDSIRAEASTLEAEYRDSGVKLAALLATEDDERKVAEREAAALGALGDSETRALLELRSKTGVADFLRAAAGGAAVVGAAAEFAAACGVPTTGHIPMSIFTRTTPPVEQRAITPAPGVKGALQPVIPYLFERSAAASLGIMMPSVPSGQVQIAKSGRLHRRILWQKTARLRRRRRRSRS